jgi:hypothetical protein
MHMKKHDVAPAERGANGHEGSGVLFCASAVDGSLPTSLKSRLKKTFRTTKQKHRVNIRPTDVIGITVEGTEEQIICVLPADVHVANVQV